MTKRTIDDIFQELDDLWWNEWEEMNFLQNLFGLHHWPAPYWEKRGCAEWVKVLYWEPPYHPINAMQEVGLTLRKMKTLFNQKHDEFAVKCFEIESKIVECENDG